MTGGPFRVIADGVTVAVRLTPKASENAIRGIERDTDGAARIRAAVTTVPEDGKANAALLKLLAKTWKLPKTSLSIASGAMSRNKVVHIAGRPDDLSRLLETWRGTRG